MTSQRTSSTLDRPVHHWTGRQREVLDLLARGRTNAQIADSLGVSLDGAKWHVREIMAELNAPTRDDAAEYWRTYNGLPSRFGRLARALFGVSLLRGAAIAAGAVAAVGVAIAVTLVATGGGDDPSRSAGSDATQTPGASVTVAGSATPVVNANDRRTGIPEVDNVIELVLSKDTAGLLAIANTFPEKCSTTPPQRLGSLPLCGPGTPDGGDILSTRGMGCERQTPKYLLETFLLDSDLTLYAVFRPPAGDIFGYVPKGDYSIVFSGTKHFPERYEVRGGRLNGVQIGCGGGPEILKAMMADAGTNYVLPPAFTLPAPTPTLAPSKSGYEDSKQVGITSVDVIIGTVRSRDLQRITEHFKLSPIGCITEPVGFPSPPYCKAGQPRGSPVDVIPVGVGCEGELWERFELPRLAQRLATPGLRLYAVYERQSRTPPLGLPEGKYGVIFSSPDGWALELAVDSERILAVSGGCGATAADLAANARRADWILPPP